MKTFPIGVALVLAAIAAVLLPGLALAAQHREQPRLSLEATPEVRLGDQVTTAAQLTTVSGQPIPGAPIRFLTTGAWGEDIANTEFELGTAVTDASGVARLSFQARRSGANEVIARFDGDERREPARAAIAVTVAGSFQLYRIEPSVISVRAPRLAPVLLGTVLATVWGLYLLIARMILRIARSGELVPAAAGEPEFDLGRRRFLRTIVPMGMHAVIAPIGLGLVTVVSRSPYTHANVQEHQPAESKYRRTPYAHVEDEALMAELPPVLDREVSFFREVLPILLANAGPHAVPPKNSPPPRGVRLDSYEHIMEREGLVVPGEPEESELVEVLVNPAMRMPPSLPPLPDEVIRLIVSWIAQGARDN